MVDLPVIREEILIVGLLLYAIDNWTQHGGDISVLKIVVLTLYPHACATDTTAPY